MRRRRRSGSAGEPTASSAAAVTAGRGVQLQTQQPRALPSQSLPAAHIDDAAHVRLPLEEVTIRAAAAAARAAPIAEPLPRDAADGVLIWSALPGAVARVRAAYTMAQLARIRRTLARMTVPLLRAATRLFDRPAPRAAQLAAELAAAGAGAADAAGAACGYAALSEMLEAAAPWVDSTAALATARGLPLAGPDGIPVYYFNGNDDAPRALYAGGVSGAMRDPLRWLMHAHTLMLVGGRVTYERALTALTGASSVGVTPPPLTGTADQLGRLPLPAVWVALTDGGRIHPADVATEAGTFLLLALTYDATTTLAAVMHRTAANARPSLARTGATPIFVPGVIPLLPRLHAHPGLRVAHAPYADEKAVRGARAPTRVHPGGALEAALTPLWTLAGDGTSWRFEGFA